MKLNICILFAILLGYYSTSSQTLTINRTDVHNPDADFVTATYTFSIEVFLEGLKNSNSVSFKLNYDHSDYVKFSQWKRGDYDVLQAVNFDNEDGTASLIIGVSSGLIAQPDENTTPKVIELEFVVNKNAPDLETLIMTFERPVATTLDIFVGEKIPLTTQTLRYFIHSFVEVWPGDTDNNGIVDHLDFAPISQYIGYRSTSDGMRSFRRQNSSAMWVPQRSLTWDSAMVTFADCDGNGDITTSDLLIVTYNLGKSIDNPFGGVNSIKQNEKSINNEKEIFASQLYEIPIKINTNRQFTGIAGTIELIDNIDNFSNISLGNILPEDSYVYYFPKGNLVHFIISNQNNNYNILNKGTIFNINYLNKTLNPSYIIKDLYAIDKSANIFELSTLISSVNSNIDEFDIRYSNNNIYILYSENIEKVSLFDIMGNCLNNYSISRNNQIIDVSNLSSGLYFIKININNTNYFRKISIIK